MHLGNIDCRLDYRISRLSFKILLVEKLSIVHVNQKNLNGKLRKKLGGATRGPTKNMGAMAHPGPPLESPLT